LRELKDAFSRENFAVHAVVTRVALDDMNNATKVVHANVSVMYGFPIPGVYWDPKLYNNVTLINFDSPRLPLLEGCYKTLRSNVTDQASAITFNGTVISM
ncbi:hypothetical protein PMAYCL1PPCAC_21335, partial [Pristionchus mayeri]